MSRILIFVGPTLSVEEITALVPQAEILPPIAAGDLSRLSLEPGDLVAIIDGFYLQSSSVRHKEILSLLHRGIHVWGAASMGALRGAELAVFGMHGFGRIFEAYAAGDIDGDDEVAVVHAPQEMDYINLTEALVNIRYACEQAVMSGILSPADQAVIIESAAGLPFQERAYQRILQLAVERGLARPAAEAFHDFVRQQRPDLKHSDALVMMQALRTPPQGPFKATFDYHETTYIRRLRVNEQGSLMDESNWVPDIDVLTAYQLFGADYPQVHSRLLLETLAGIAARTLDEPAATSREQQIALVARFMMTQYGFDARQGFPAHIERWLSAEECLLPFEEQLVLLAIRLWHVPQSLYWQEVLITHLKKSELFASLFKTVAHSYVFNETLEAQLSDLHIELLPATEVCRWFLQRWEVPAGASIELKLLDRGFKDVTDFLQKARPFYLFDKHIGVPPVEELVPAL